MFASSIINAANLRSVSGFILPERETTSTILTWGRDVSPLIKSANSHINPRGGVPEHSVSPSTPSVALFFFCPLPPCTQIAQRPSEPLPEFVAIVLPRRQSSSRKHIASWSVRIETLMRGFQAGHHLAPSPILLPLTLAHSLQHFQKGHPYLASETFTLRNHVPYRALYSGKNCLPLRFCNVSILHWLRPS